MHYTQHDYSNQHVLSDFLLSLKTNTASPNFADRRQLQAYRVNSRGSTDDGVILQLAGWGGQLTDSHHKEKHVTERYTTPRTWADSFDKTSDHRVQKLQRNAQKTNVKVSPVIK